jgi:hypothetical protein
MESKHVVIHLIGGLGNQLFQIVFGLVLQKRFGLNVHFDASSFSCGQGNSPYAYLGSLYKNLSEKLVNHNYELEYREKNWSYYNVNNDIYSLFLTHDSIKIIGYWQSEQHFPNMKNELRILFDLTHPYMYIPKQIFIDYPILHDISAMKTCLICVRRGDYLKAPNVHNPCGMSYYMHAISYFPIDTRFFIVSDDLEWCRCSFGSDEKYVFLDICDDLTTFYVGTLFPNYIISNSTFYWWISYFSIHTNPRIIAPNKWINASNYETIYRSDMIIIERPIEI